MAPYKDVMSNTEEERISAGLRLVVKDGLASQVMLSLTAGPFLVAFALTLGASSGHIGILAAIPFLTQLVQIPSVYLIEKLRSRRAISVYASSISRAFLLLIALIPILFATQTGIAPLLAAFLLHSIFGSLSSVSWSSWMRDFIPQNQFGNFHSRRMRVSTALSIPVTLGAGIFIDYWRRFFPDELLSGYSLLFFFGSVAGMVSVYFISVTPESPMPDSEQTMRTKELLLGPFHDGNFRNTLAFLSSWSFSVNLAAPFFTVYLLERMHLDISVVVGLLLLSQIANLFFTGIWGRLSDRFSNKSVLAVAAPSFMICILAWTFVTFLEKHALAVPLLAAIHLFMGVSTSGVALASTNIRLKLAPKETATAYLAVSGLASSLAGGFGAVLGGALASFFAVRELSLTLEWIELGADFVSRTLDFKGWSFLFLLAFLAGLFSIHRLALVRERGEVEEGVLRQELLLEIRRDLRSFSTAYGLRRLIQFHGSVQNAKPNA